MGELETGSILGRPKAVTGKLSSTKSPGAWAVWNFGIAVEIRRSRQPCYGEGAYVQSLREHSGLPGELPVLIVTGFGQAPKKY